MIIDDYEGWTRRRDVCQPLGWSTLTQARPALLSMIYYRRTLYSSMETQISELSSYFSDLTNIQSGSLIPESPLPNLTVWLDL